MADFTMTIAGEAATTHETFEVSNPATGSPVASAPSCSRDDLDRAMAAASLAFAPWRSDETARREAMKACAEALRAAAPALAATLTAEQGKPLRESFFEVYGASIWLDYYADLELPQHLLQDDAKARVEVVRRPLGVVAAITPWNFPVALAGWKLAPALRAGNTVVLKPSPYTPLSTLQMGEVLREVLPPGVCNVVSGGDELGAWMTEHPVPRKLSFTGSVATGKKVAAAAAPDLKRLTLELGGNDAAIVLDDVDIDNVADSLFWGAFVNCGQVCSAIKRIYAPEGLYDDVVAALAERAASVVVGNGADDDTQLGPLNNRPQQRRVAELVDAAVAAGARVAAGGKVRGDVGNFYEPTILADVSDGVRIVDEEQFGPALPVISYRDLDDAIARANASHFGLCGSVWTSDPERGAPVAAQLECGTAWVNTHFDLVGPQQPFGGLKWSGVGVENGVEGLEGFTDVQVLHTVRS